MRVIAHRGASGSRPENTLAAFRHAVTLGADMIELDVQRTRDGHVVVLHDANVERTTDGHGRVSDATLAGLKALDAGAWFAPAFRGERIPTLEETLAAVRVPLNVELKPAGDDGLEKAVLACVEDAGALDRIVFSAFDLAALARMRSLAPRAELAVLWSRGAAAKALQAADGVAARALHLRNGRHAPATAAAAVAAGLAVRVWTVNDPAELAVLGPAGVEGLFTDFPERFLHSPSAS